MHRVAVTPAGAELIAWIAAARNQMMDEMLHDWDERSKTELTHLMHRLARAMRTPR